MRNNNGIHWPLLLLPLNRTFRVQFIAGFYIVQIPGHRYNRLFAVSNNLQSITSDVSQFGNFISSLLIGHMHVRPHTLNSLCGCDPEINNSKLRTGSTEHSDNNSHEVLIDQHTLVTYRSSHGYKEMSKCCTCLPFYR